MKRHATTPHLSDYSTRSKELQESAIPEFRKRFDEGLESVSLEGVHGAISALDSTLTSSINKAISGDLNKRINAKSQLSAELKEAASRVELRESLVVTNNDAEVTQIDASSLQIGSDVLRSRLPGAEQRFEMFFGGVKQKPPENLKAIQIPRGVREVTVKSILSLPVLLADTCMKSPALKFRMLRLSLARTLPRSSYCSHQFARNLHSELSVSV